MMLTHPLLEDRVPHGFGERGAVGPPDLRRPKQVHGAAVVDAGACAEGAMPEADAVVSRLPGAAVGVVTADCLPVLMATAAGDAVAAVHAGWRGLAQGVLPAAVAALRETAGGSPRMIAAIGPYIGACCYEVDAPVLDALGARFGAALAGATRPARAGRALLDLGQLAREALVAAGVAPRDVGALAGVCTRCDAGRFHSYRRDGPRAGRLVHFIRPA
jgi:hypothetical protein